MRGGIARGQTGRVVGRERVGSVGSDGLISTHGDLQSIKLRFRECHSTHIQRDRHMKCNIVHVLKLTRARAQKDKRADAFAS